MILRRVVLLAVPALLFLLTAACKSPDLERMGETEYPPRPADWPIDVFVDPEMREATEWVARMGTGSTGFGPAGARLVGRFSALSDGYGVLPPVEEARGKARRVGGDAVIVMRMIVFTYENDLAPDGSGCRKAYRMEGTVLRYPDRGAVR